MLMLILPRFYISGNYSRNQSEREMSGNAALLFDENLDAVLAGIVIRADGLSLYVLPGDPKIDEK